MRISDWSSDVCSSDLLMRRYTLEGSSLQFVADMVAAQPPRSAQAASSVPADFGSVVRRVSYGVGSNAVALGKDATTDGRGLLLGNPHYPWQGILRFYQFHLTIPGKLAVMGAALPGLPVVNIGDRKSTR